MNQPDTADAVGRIVADVLGLPCVEATSSIQNTLEWDSLSHLQILDAIESHFGLVVDLIEIAEVESMQDWVDLVDKYSQD
jgi:acyl carrier protein